MNWKKRKRLNRLAKSHGFNHAHQYNRYIKWRVILSKFIKEPRVTRDYRVINPKLEIDAIARFIAINDIDRKLNKVKDQLKAYYNYTDIRQSITIQTTGTNNIYPPTLFQFGKN